MNPQASLTRNSHTNLPVSMRCEQVHSLYVLLSGGSVSSNGFGSTDAPQAEFEIASINCLLLKLPGCVEQGKFSSK